MTKYKSLWTIVQHSGFGYGDKPGFNTGLELRCVDKKSMVKKVLSSGGLIFRTYKEATDYCYKEQYPKGYSGLYPVAPGTFSKNMIDELRIYIPKDIKAASELGAVVNIQSFIDQEFGA